MPVNDRAHFQKRFAYHHWATDRVLDALAPLTPGQLDERFGGSFGTGRALLRHIVGVERLWCDRWKGESAKGLPDFPATHSARDYRAEWETVKLDQQHFLAELSEYQIKGELTYVNIKGEKWTYPFTDILEHCVNHGTYHRGQVTHLLRDRGLAAPSTDYLIFADEFRKR